LDFWAALLGPDFAEPAMLYGIGARMNAEIEQKREQLADLCGCHHVRRLALFGSALRDDFDPKRSDLDFAVEFDPLPPGTYPDIWFGLYEGLEQLFGHSIDLVSGSFIKNPYFRKSVEETQAVLYAACAGMSRCDCWASAASSPMHRAAWKGCATTLGRNGGADFSGSYRSPAGLHFAICCCSWAARAGV
jgi:hypothetical protein